MFFKDLLKIFNVNQYIKSNILWKTITIYTLIWPFLIIIIINVL